jgi:hypothetical protein
MKSKCNCKKEIVQTQDCMFFCDKVRREKEHMIYMHMGIFIIIFCIGYLIIVIKKKKVENPRIKNLKKMYRKGLISEEEFKKKNDAINRNNKV